MKGLVTLAIAHDLSRCQVQRREFRRAATMLACSLGLEALALRLGVFDREVAA